MSERRQDASARSLARNAGLFPADAMANGLRAAGSGPVVRSEAHSLRQTRGAGFDGPGPGRLERRDRACRPRERLFPPLRRESADVIAINARGLLRTIWGALSAIWRMRRTGMDAAIDLEFFARSSAALCYLSGAVWRVGYHPFGGEASYRGNLMTHRLSFNPYLHTSQAFQIMVEALDCGAAELPTYGRLPPAPNPGSAEFRPSVEEVAAVRRLVEEHVGRGTAHRLILLNANASDLIPLRKWPSERYVELARLLLARHADAAVAFTGAPGEQARAEELVNQVGSDRCFSVAGKTTLRQLLVLVGLADVLVTAARLISPR